MKNQTNN